MVAKYVDGTEFSKYLARTFQEVFEESYGSYEAGLHRGVIENMENRNLTLP